MEEAREQFTFYRSFYEAVSKIKNKAARADAYDAIFRSERSNACVPCHKIEHRRRSNGG